MVKEALLNNAQFFYPFIKDRIKECRIDGPSALFIRLDDGVYLYDDFERLLIALPGDSSRMTEQECRYEFARRLRRLMMVYCVNQNELSERTGISQAMISKYVTGKSEPGFYNLDKIARALGCSTEEFRYMY